MTKTYSIANALRLTLSFDTIQYGLDPDALFFPAVRRNQKRGFLFVSKVLGKHLAIRPAALSAAAKLLACADTGAVPDTLFTDTVNQTAAPPFPSLYRSVVSSRTLVPESTLFIGFAETATGLAQAVADCFDGDFCYASTTRMEISGMRSLQFQEVHSHASEHFLYLDRIADFMKRCRRVVLIDDELTTGNTSLNLIRELHRMYGIQKYAIYTLLDWSNPEQRRKLERELHSSIEVISLVKGHILEVESAQPDFEPEEYSGNAGADYQAVRAGALLTCPSGAFSPGRTAFTGIELHRQAEYSRQLAAALCVSPERTLFLGTGECIYTPMLLAGFCGGQSFHSTTQSPVIPLEGSAIVSGAHFHAPDCYSATGYVYNIPAGTFEQAVIFSEQETQQAAGLRQLTAYLNNLGIRKVTVVSL